MNHKQRLEQIWKEAQQNKYLPDFVYENKYSYFPNVQQKDILVLGIAQRIINKSFSQTTPSEIEKDNKNTQHSILYYQRVSSLLQDKTTEENLHTVSTHLNLFYYRVEDILNPMLNSLLDNVVGRMFLNDQLQLTQQQIENVIKPKVIIANSMQAASFLGIYGDKCDSDWMGYQVKYVGEIQNKYDVYQIRGVKQQVIDTGFFVKKTQLVGTFVICCNDLLGSERNFVTKCISLDLIKYFIEVAFLDNYLDQSRFYSIDVDTLLQYPWILQTGRSFGRNLDLTSILTDLEFFKNARPIDIAQYIFQKLSANKTLSFQELKNLQEESYCKKVFKAPREILLKITQEERKYIMNNFNLYKRQYFILNIRWSSKTIEFLKKWYFNTINDSCF